ncbi:MAG: hypothetical protein ACFFD4_36570 [Candidatus Odinarchaeota archaeon]
MNRDEIDLTGINPDVLKEIEYQITAFTKMDLEAVRNRLGVVMYQVYTHGTYDPQVILKADFSRHVKNALASTKIVLKEKLCNLGIDAVEQTLTIAYVVKILTTELNWPESAVVLLAIFLVRRFGKGLAEWICSDKGEDDFGAGIYT